jgi:glyoxylase-like metal-dependent hydrolase (beta-lactamase superfamily II)
MKQMAWGASLMLLGLGCGDDEPKADSAKDKLIAALGGEDTLAALSGLRIEGSGKRLIVHEGFTPDAAPIESNSFERTVSIDLDDDYLRVDTDRTIEFLFPGMQTYSEILRGNLGASTEPFFGSPLGALGSDKAAAIRRQELLLTPQLLLRELDTDAFTTQSDVQLEGVTHHRLVASGGPAPLTLFVNADTGVLSKVETQELDFYLRDVPLEIFYSDWQPAEGGISFPRELRLDRDGLTLLTEDVSEVAVDPTFDAGAFDFPSGVTPAFDAALYARGELSHQWYYLLDSIGLPFNGVDVSITPTEIAPGVFHLVGASHHSFLVEQENGLVLVDAPLHDDRGKALFDFISGQFPDKPITFVAASHFHEDHVSGIREVLGLTEASLLVQESSEPFWRDVLAAPSTLDPDALEENPRDVDIETVADGEAFTLDDAAHPLTFYHVNTTHAADMLLAHDTASNVVFVVDIFSPGNATQLAAEDLDAAIVAYDIPVAGLRIAGGHGTGVVDYATFQAQLP